MAPLGVEIGEENYVAITRFYESASQTSVISALCLHKCVSMRLCGSVKIRTTPARAVKFSRYNEYHEVPPFALPCIETSDSKRS